jgi:PAS domain S-box-containing protein
MIVDDDRALAPQTPASVPAATLSGLPLALVLTNPAAEDNPIVYANAAFATLTGYPVDAIIGRNCRFLQGPQTEPDRVARIRAAVDAGEDIAVEITNHRADGTPFLNRLTITPVTDDGEIVYFLGTQSARDPNDAEARLETVQLQLAEVQHRVKNHLAMVVSLIRMQAREPGQDYVVLARRIEALQLLYQELSDTGVASTGQDEVPLGAYVSRIAAAIGHLDGGQGVRINVQAEEIRVDATTAGRVGLLVSEILTNAFRHAFTGRDGGLVETRLQRLSDGTVRVTVADDGVGLPDGHGWPTRGNLGSRIVSALLTGLEARHSVDTSTAGTTITIDIPAAAASTQGEPHALDP